MLLLKRYRNAPDEECPRSGSDVCLLPIVVDGGGGCNGVDVGPQEEEVDEDVDDLEENAVGPGVGHGG